MTLFILIGAPAKLKLKVLRRRVNNKLSVWLRKEDKFNTVRNILAD